jgi:choline-sulfatase
MSDAQPPIAVTASRATRWRSRRLSSTLFSRSMFSSTRCSDRGPRYRVLLGAALLALAIGGCSSDRAPGKSPSNILLIVIDTLRADRLGCYGNTRGLTPFIDGLAEQGTVFVNAYAPSSWTCPSVASLMTSRYPTQHKVNSFSAKLGAAEVTLAEKLAPLGYAAAGFSANPRLMQRLGYAKGFEHWRCDTQDGAPLPRGGELRRQSLEWLDGHWNPASPTPVLLYFQYMEPHFPYEAPEPFRSRFGRTDEQAMAEHNELARRVFGGQSDGLTPDDFANVQGWYDAEVAAVDEEIRLLFAELERRGFMRQAIVVITADHGEEFWEHGGIFHGRSLYNESVRIPLIIVSPGHLGGRRVGENVSLLDVAPTILDLVGAAPEPRFEGRSLAPLLTSRSWPRRLYQLRRQRQGNSGPAEVFFHLEDHSGRWLDERAHTAGMARGPLKLLLTREGTTEAFDLSTDPGEQHPNPPALHDKTAELAERIKEVVTDLERRAGVAESGPPLDEGTKEKLRALGYAF